MIYFIRSGQYVKIGVSNHPLVRLANLQAANPGHLELIATIPGSYELEAELHQRFADHHYRGEWFHYTERVMALINGAVSRAQGGKPDDAGEWRFEIKRKPRKASRKNAGSTAAGKWYYWVIRVHSDGRRLYYGTLADIGITQ